MCREAYPYFLIEPLLGLLYCLIVDLLIDRSIEIEIEIFGGHSEEAPPVSIPNTVVKLFCADGTAWVTMWESRSPPIALYKTPRFMRAWGFLRFAVT
jgi:hypothetical protein